MYQCPFQPLAKKFFCKKLNHVVFLQVRKDRTNKEIMKDLVDRKALKRVAFEYLFFIFQNFLNQYKVYQQYFYK